MSALMRQIMLDSPYLYWRLTDTSGTTAADASGNSRTGTINGTPSLAFRNMGSVYRYMDFDASNDYVQGPNSPSITAGTLECTFVLDTYQAGGVNIRNLWGWGVSGNNFELRVGNAGAQTNLEFVAQRTGPVLADSAAVGAAVLSVVTHLAGTWDGSNLRLYKNGVLVAGPTAFSGTINGGQAFFAGTDATLARLYDGALGEVAFYTTALSADRVAAHAAAAITAGVSY